MRYIRKPFNGNSCVIAQHATPPQTSDEATRRWLNLACKQQLTKDLIDEQYGLCCYSELRADEEGLGYHIEHVKNKSQFPGHTFDYFNLAVSALKSDDLQILKQQAAEIFAGHAPSKQGTVDFSLFVSCFDVEAPKFFAYLSDGRVVPSKQLINQHDIDRASYTIATLNLNSPYLVNLRRKWWDELDDLFSEHTTKGWNLSDLVQIDLTPCNQRLSRFFSLTRQFYGNLAEQTLQQYEPGLL